MKIITLCGSTKFKKEFMEVQEKLTLQGNIVLNLGVFSKADNLFLLESSKEMLSALHRLKIKMSDEIYVVNKNGYIGEGTLKEIKYAKSLGKPVNYYEENNVLR